MRLTRRLVNGAENNRKQTDYAFIATDEDKAVVIQMCVDRTFICGNLISSEMK